MKLYTRTGDDGRTGLIGGDRVGKDDPRVAAYGQVDELCAVIGWSLAACDHDEWTTVLRAVQGDLFVMGAELATAAHRTPACVIGTDRVGVLEGWIDRWAPDPPLRHFVLPGGSELASRWHVARTVCRRAERAVAGLLGNAVAGDSASGDAAGNARASVAGVYLNRLADLLFALAVTANRRAGVADIEWAGPPSGD